MLFKYVSFASQVLCYLMVAAGVVVSGWGFKRSRKVGYVFLALCFLWGPVFSPLLRPVMRFALQSAVSGPSPTPATEEKVAPSPSEAHRAASAYDPYYIEIPLTTGLLLVAACLFARKEKGNKEQLTRGSS